MQGHIRKSMREVLIAMSPSIGIASERLLAEFEQLVDLDTHTAGPAPQRDELGPRSADPSRLVLTFQHDCL